MLILRCASIIGEGAFADVFQLPNGRVCKLYRSAGTPKWPQWARRFHHEELEAYAKAAEHALLRNHVPTCYGPTTVDAVFDSGGFNCSAKYYLDLNIVLDQLDGDDCEARGEDPDTFPHISRLIEEFRKAGLNAEDATVFRFESAADCRFIDITTAFGAALREEI